MSSARWPDACEHHTGARGAYSHTQQLPPPSTKQLAKMQTIAKRSAFKAAPQQQQRKLTAVQKVQQVAGSILIAAGA